MGKNYTGEEKHAIFWCSEHSLNHNPKYKSCAPLKGIKKCVTCKKLKTVEDFYKNRWSRDGLATSCGNCTCKASAERYKRDRFSSLKQMAGYIRNLSPEARKRRNKLIVTAKARNPVSAIKQRARYRAGRAIAKGIITRQPCEKCGEEKAVAHHYLGYEGEHWKDVMWLCIPCHKKEHGFINWEAMR